MKCTNKDAETILKNDAVKEVRKACDMFSDLYFHMTKVLLDRFGEEEAKAIVTEIVSTRAAERGDRLAAKAKTMGLEANNENLGQVTDIPFLGWDASYGKYSCPFAESWSKRYTDNPWFSDFAPLYCDVNDAVVHEHYTGTETQKITKNVLRGDDHCERIYLPI